MVMLKLVYNGMCKLLNLCIIEFLFLSIFVYFFSCFYGNEDKDKLYVEKSTSQSGFINLTLKNTIKDHRFCNLFMTIYF
jgi:hypothetical protein